ncbi:DCN1-like protein 4 [Tanacetum coccineum]
MKADPQLQQQDIAIWLALQMKFETLQVPQTTCRTLAVCLRDQDDPHDDAHPEGENSTMAMQKQGCYGLYSVFIRVQVSKPENLLDFYCFAFNYCLTEDKQKTLDLESVCLLLDLVLGPKFRQQVDSFSEYLKIQKEYKVINMDQWTNFFRFCHELKQAVLIKLIDFLEILNEQGTNAYPVYKYSAAAEPV